jgi:hypothetical protein
LKCFEFRLAEGSSGSLFEFLVLRAVHSFCLGYDGFAPPDRGELRGSCSLTVSALSTGGEHSMTIYPRAATPRFQADAAERDRRYGRRCGTSHSAATTAAAGVQDDR